MIYVAYGPPNGPAHCLTTPENCERHSFFLEEGDVALYTIHADNWEEAMEVYYAIQQWGKYIPMSSVNLTDEPNQD